jgi:ABC-type multidrug transport system ATPase subunit
VLFLDEPTTGIDPVSRKELWAMLRKLKSEGITIVVSTPYMDEAMLCDRIALMQKGKIMTIDTPQGIIDKFPQKVFAVKSANMSRLLDDLRGFVSVKSCHTFGEFHHITIDNEQLTIDNLKNALTEIGHTNVIINEITPTIEDCFMNLTDNQK